MSTSLGDITVAFGASMDGLQAGISQAQGLLSSFGGVAGTLVAGASAAVVGVGVAATKMAGDFQAGVTTLVTGAGESVKNIGMIKDGLLSMATATGTSTQQLTSGLYMIESAGYHGAAGLQVLQAAAMGAKVGNADLGTVADATTTIMTDFGLKSSQASVAVNTLIATVSSGKTTMQALSGSLSQVLPTAAAVHVSLTDTAAAMATMTGEGIPAANAATYLRQMLMSLDNPASKAQTTLKAIGLTSGEVTSEMQKSLPGALQMITDRLKAVYGDGTPAYTAALANIAGGSKQMQGWLDLTGQHIDTFKSNVVSISDAVKQGGNSINGWAQVQEDFNFKIAQAAQVVQTLMIKIGSALLPVLSQIVGNITPVIAAFGDWIIKSNIIGNVISTLSSIFGAIGHVLGQVADAFKAVFLPVQQVATVVQSATTATKPLLDTFDRATGIFTQVKTATQPLLDTFDRGKSILTQTGTAAKPLLDTFDRATGVIHQVNTATQPMLDTFDRATGVLHNTGAGAQHVTQAVNPFVALFRNLVPFVQGAVEAFKLLIQGFQTAVSIGARVISFFQQNEVAMALLKGALIAIGVIAVAMWTTWAVAAGAAAIATIAATWPLLLIGAVIAAVAAVIILNWNRIAPAITPALNAIGTVLHNIGDFLASTFKPIWDQLIQTWQSQLLPLFKQLWSALTPLSPLLQAIAGIIAAVVVVALGLLVGVIAGVVKAFAGLLSGVIMVFAGIAQIITGAVQIISGILRVIVDLFTGNFTDLGAALGQIWQGIVNMFKGVWEVIAGIFQAAWGLISGLVTGFVQGIIGFFQTLYDTLVGHSIVPDMVTAIISWFASLPGKAMSAIQSFAGMIGGFFSGLAGQAVQWGTNLIQSFINGITGMLGNVQNAVGSVMSTVAGFLGFHSPSKEGPGRDADKWAPNLVKMFQQGLQQGQPSLEATLNTMLAPKINTSSATQAVQAAAASSANQPPILVHVMLDGRQIGQSIINNTRLQTGIRQ